jgi:hypothetical protein
MGVSDGVSQFGFVASYSTVHIFCAPKFAASGSLMGDPIALSDPV